MSGTKSASVGATSTGHETDLAARFDRCQIGTQASAAIRTGGRRDDDRIRLLRYIVNHPEGAPLPKIWRDMFGHSGPVDPSDADYRFTRRFYTGNPELFETYEQNGMTAVAPALGAFDLIAEGITQKQALEGGLTDRQFCRDLVESVDALTERGKEILSESVRSYVRRIDDYRLLFELQDLRSGSTTYLTKRYKTRFNDQGRINQQWARYNGALEHAREEYDNAVLCTLTTDPKRHESLGAAIRSITENFNRLMSWMAYEPTTKETSRPGYRPSYLMAIEFSEQGFPHLHILFFDVPTRADGMPWLIDKQELSSKWAQLGQGEIVDLKPLIYSDELPDGYADTDGFVSWEDFAGPNRPTPSDNGEDSEVIEWAAGTTAGRYLGKYLSATFGGVMDLATDGGVEVSTDGAYDRKADAYKVGLYWATGKRMWTCSRDIEEAIDIEDGDEEALPVVIRYVGTYVWWDLPMSVRVEARPFADHATVRYSRGPNTPEPTIDGDRPPDESSSSSLA